jgi:hypothetical protein
MGERNEGLQRPGRWVMRRSVSLLLVAGLLLALDGLFAGKGVLGSPIIVYMMSAE